MSSNDPADRPFEGTDDAAEAPLATSAFPWLLLQKTDTTVTTADTEVASVSLGRLAGANTRGRSVQVVAPSTAGTYHYGACVDTVAGEADPANNCSPAVSVTVTEGAPDLVLGGVSVDMDTLEAEADFKLGVVVRNRGNGRAPETTLRYLRSDDETVSVEDTEVGNATVGAIAPGGESKHSLALEAPADAGTVYYGACVDAVSGESDPDNNCSAGVAVTVREDEDDDHEGDGYCRPGTIVEPGGGCTVYRLEYTFDVDSNGRGCLRASFTGCSGRSLSFEFGSLTFVAARRDDNSWEIENVDPAPPD